MNHAAAFAKAGTWDEADHPRGKTTAESTPGSFRPKGGQGELFALPPVDPRDLKDALDNAERPEDIYRILSQHAEPVRFGGEPYPGLYTLGPYVVEWDGTDLYPSVTDKAEWVTGVNDPTDYFPGYEDRFNARFWEAPQALYHATPSENVADILTDGLGAHARTRGLTNRSVGSAVFTTMDPSDLADGAYGDALFEVRTGAMRADGVMPYVSEEPDWQEGQLREALAASVGLDDYGYDYEAGISPSTIIVHGAIPAKYLTQLDPNDPSVQKEWNEADHPRGKTTPASTPGSFREKGEQGELRFPEQGELPLDGAEQTTAAIRAWARRRWPNNPVRQAAFRRWFGQSAAVDANGEPLLVYHTAVRDFDEFVTDPALLQTMAVGGGLDHIGSWFAETPKLANAVAMFYAQTGRAQQGALLTLPLYLSIKNPLHLQSRETMEEEIFNEVGHLLSEATTPTAVEAADFRLTTAVREVLQAEGYDGIRLDDDLGYGPAWIAFDKTQVKSVWNRGTFRGAKIDKAEWDESEHPRGKTTEESTEGSFRPKGTEGEPVEPGTTPIPPQHIRLYHYINTPRNEDKHPDDLLPQVQREGLLLARAQGHLYGEPDVVWASTTVPQHGKTFVEFSVSPDDPRLNDAWAYRDPASGALLRRYTYGPGREYGTPWTQADSDAVMARDSNVYLMGDVRPAEIVAAHASWHYMIARYATDPTGPQRLAEIRAGIESGEYAWMKEDQRYKPVYAYLTRKWGIAKRDWNEADHPRGKTTPASTEGSFEPKGGAPSAPVDPLEVQQRAIEKFEQKAIRMNRDYEEAIAVDNTGLTFIRAAGGDYIQFMPNEVADLKQAARQGRNVILTHNHPNGRGFSVGDIEFGHAVRLAEMRAAGVTPTGHNYLYSLRYNNKFPSLIRIRDVGLHYSAAVKSELLARMERGELSDPEQAEALHWHLVWERTARDLGWTYERREVAGEARKRTSRRTYQGAYGVVSI